MGGRQKIEENSSKTKVIERMVPGNGTTELSDFALAVRENGRFSGGNEVVFQEGRIAYRRIIQCQAPFTVRVRKTRIGSVDSWGKWYPKFDKDREERWTVVCKGLSRKQGVKLITAMLASSEWEAVELYPEEVKDGEE